MSACLLAGALMLALPGDGFSLEWEHSVEKTLWREEWQIADGALHLTRAAIKGSGAGMEPGPDARLQDGWWVWQPDLPALHQLTLAASGATRGGWTLCAGDQCRNIGAEPGQPLTLAPCGG